MSETVKLDISIDVHQSGVVDTEITVDEWNAMTPDQRQQVKDDNWHDMVIDNGGISVITEGATDE
jgi:hypothetical protein